MRNGTDASFRADGAGRPDLVFPDLCVEVCAVCSLTEPERDLQGSATPLAITKTAERMQMLCLDILGRVTIQMKRQVCESVEHQIGRIGVESFHAKTVGDTTGPNSCVASSTNIHIRVSHHHRLMWTGI